jgi:methyl-accepting chemotaxis protein
MQQLWFKMILLPSALGAMGVTFVLLSQAPQASMFAAAIVVTTLACLAYIRSQLTGLEELTRHLEALSEGRVDRAISLGAREDELGRMAEAATKLTAQLRETSGRMDRLARGQIGAAEIEQQVLGSLRLADADLPMRRDPHGELERHIHQLHNQLRRLTVQARLLGQDRLDSPLLNEVVAGELGDAFVQLVRRLRLLSERARQIARGELGKTVEGDGELHVAFNQMVESLQEVVEQIIQTAIRISSSAEEISLVLRDQELSASHQASSVEETQRTMETLLSSAKKIAESAQTVFKSAEKTQANNRIISDRASELKSHTERIGEILESIKEIADRSDLLALNASLEGLRAGEAGKGFTLVAAEMRRLAENIKGSVADIKELLSDIRESALSSVLAIEEGTRLSERTTDSALKITLITQQQQSGTEQVTQSMEELSHLINQGLAGTRQVTMAAGDLARLSEDLRGSMDRFIVTGVKPRLSGRHDLSTARPALARRTTEVSGEIGLASMRRTTEVSGELPVGRGVDSGPQRAMAQSSRKSMTMPGLAGAGVTGQSAPRKPQPTPIQSPIQSSHTAPSSELNATMRFLGYSEDGSVVAGDSPTVSMTPTSKARQSQARQYNEVDDLFDALPSKAAGRSTGSLSFEDHASDLERHLDEGKGDPRDDQ